MSTVVDGTTKEASRDPVLAAAGIKGHPAISASRSFDLVIAIIAFFVITGTYHLHYMLLAGDWDFWIDWKDRQYWVTLAPVVAIMFPAAAQYFLWVKFRLPFGATLCVVGLTFGEWVNRVFGFHYWAGFPYSLIWPSLLIPSALLLDTVLILSRNWLATAIIGAWLFAAVFYPANWPLLAPYRIPMEHMDQLVSVGDMVGYTFVRSATPEYLRFIERGTLRTFGGHSAVVATMFAAFLCSLVYITWWYIGKWFSREEWISNPFAKYMGTKTDLTEKP